MQDFKKLRVWQQSHQLTLQIYRITARFPSDERFGLISQLRRASSSIGANIAEGCGRDTDKEFARFLRMAMGSAFEVENFLLLAGDLGLFKEDDEDVANSLAGVKRMLNSFLTTLSSSRPIAKS